MASMLLAGYRIIVLGRSNREETLNERIFKLLRWFGIEELADHLELVEIDLLKPKLGLAEKVYKQFCEKTEEIIHCASDTSFSERKRDIVFKSNVASLDGILEFAGDSKVEFFHYISTAYVAGTGMIYCKEILPLAKTFTNVYEESKAAAENIISGF